MKRVIALALFGMLVALPAHGQTRNAMEQEVLKASELLRDASLITKDRSIMERLYADDYMYTHSHGTVENKKEEIAGLISRYEFTIIAGKEFSQPRVRVVQFVALRQTVLDAR